MKRFGLGVLAAVASLLAVPEGQADTLGAAADAQTSSAQPALRFGRLPVMAVRHGPKASVLASYVQFDVSALPSEPAAQSAVLRLWVRSVVTPGMIEVVPVLAPWQESTITAGSSPELGAPVAVFAVEEGHASQFVDVDITGLVREWTSGSLENHGLALRPDEAGAVNVTFHAREGFLTSHVPSLEVLRAEGGAASGPAGPREPEGLGPFRIPVGSVMFFDLATCPPGWTAFVEARGRALVGLNPDGTLRGTQGPPLANLAPRLISGNSGIVAHNHVVTVAPEAAHTHTVTVSPEAAHTHAVEHPPFTTAVGGSHTHTTGSAGSHSHDLDLGNGGGSPGLAHFAGIGTTVGDASTATAGAHTHTVQSTNSAHDHVIDVPLLPASGPGSSHTHAATAVSAGGHAHNTTVTVAGVASVDVTLPYVQLLVCRKD